MFDVTHYSDVIYVLITGIVGILLTWWTVRKIISLMTHYNKRAEEGKEIREGTAVSGAILIFIAWGAFILLAVAGWNFKQDLLYEEKPENPAEKAAVKKVMEHEPAPDEELAKKKEKLVEQRDTKPHEKKLSSFDEKMATEAEKIKQRNQ